MGLPDGVMRPRQGGVGDGGADAGGRPVCWPAPAAIPWFRWQRRPTSRL
jgi:hypothetical protein